MNIETDLNLSLAPELAVRLLKHPLLTESKPVHQRVVHAYYDAPDQRLRRERVIVGYATARCVSNRQAARASLKSVDYSRLLLEFTAAVLALPEGKARRLAAFAPRCLEKRAEQVRQLAEEALSGDAASRHHLRVAYKRLRYALEFFAPLFPGAALRDYHVAASGLQEILGKLNDLAVAMELTAEARPDEHGENIRCWLERQSERLLPELGVLVDAFREQEAPWRTQ